MGQMTPSTWPFDVEPNSSVVTTTYVTSGKEPILYVTHEYDDEEGVIWQFHSGNGDYTGDVLRLVLLSEILEIDPSIYELAKLPRGFYARRSAVGAPWETGKE